MAPAVVERNTHVIVPDSDESLEHLQRRLIAEMLHKRLDEITDRFLDEFLDTNVYPHGRFNLSSEYGGYENGHLDVRTRHELDETERTVARAREALKRELAKLKR